MYYFKYHTEFGEITIFYNEKGVTSVTLPYDKQESISGIEYLENDKIKKYFQDYFSGEEPEKIVIDVKVTDFQKKVYDILLTTTRGTVLTYGDIAKLIGCGCNQAVGQALKRNPCPLIIPCHRVVGKNWDGGFGGEIDGPKIEFKKYLLKLEGC